MTRVEIEEIVDQYLEDAINSACDLRSGCDNKNEEIKQANQMARVYLLNQPASHILDCFQSHDLAAWLSCIKGCVISNEYHIWFKNCDTVDWENVKLHVKLPQDVAQKLDEITIRDSNFVITAIFLWFHFPPPSKPKKSQITKRTIPSLFDEEEN